MKKVIVLSLLYLGMVSCESNIPDNGNDFHGTSIRLSNPNYGQTINYNEGKVGRHTICNGAFDWGRNFGNTWYFNEFDNGNIRHYEKLYTDSVGYIEFGEGGLGELVMVNQDTLQFNIPFTYEIVGKDQNNYYYRIDWEDVKIRTYVQYVNSGSPLMTFEYQDLGEGLFMYEGSMDNFDGIFSWGGNYISYFNNDFTNCYK